MIELENRGNIRLINLKKDKVPYDQYIGRGNSFYGFSESKWHNPIPLNKEADRGIVLARHRLHLLSKPELILSLKELKGQTLACYCCNYSTETGFKGKMCHGLNLVRLYDKLVDVPMIAFISGHLDLTQDEFELQYSMPIDEALRQGHSFVVGDARGADHLAQRYLLNKTDKVTVFHMFDAPRHNVGFDTRGGFSTDEDRDDAMTRNSTYDIAWFRTGREKSGTANNILRRFNLKYSQQ